jgi:TRAP-type C4-dicarboxylate transport system permease small subunit
MRIIGTIASALDWITERILTLCKGVTIGLVAAIAIVIFLGVFTRYVLGNALAWYEEGAKFLMLWLVFIAAPITLKRGGLVAIDMIIKWFPARLRYFNFLVVFSAVLYFLYWLVWEGWGLAWNARVQVPTSIDISYFWIYLAIPLGSGIMFLILVEHWLQALMGVIDPRQTFAFESHEEEARSMGE